MGPILKITEKKYVFAGNKDTDLKVDDIFKQK